VTWIVENQGSFRPPASWNDRVVLSQDPAPGGADDTCSVISPTVRSRCRWPLHSDSNGSSRRSTYRNFFIYVIADSGNTLNSLAARTIINRRSRQSISGQTSRIWRWPHHGSEYRAKRRPLAIVVARGQRGNHGDQCVDVDRSSSTFDGSDPLIVRPGVGNRLTQRNYRRRRRYTAQSNLLLPADLQGTFTSSSQRIRAIRFMKTIHDTMSRVRRTP